MKKRNNILLFLALCPFTLLSQEFIQPGDDDFGPPPPPGEEVPVDMYLMVMVFIALCYSFYIYNKIVLKNK